MPNVDANLSTGLPGLDRVLRGLIPGDNVVWQIAHHDQYPPFVRHFADHALGRSRNVNYFRFSEMAPPVIDGEGVRRHLLHPEEGFEGFIAEVHRVIEQDGGDGVHIFDCLSDLTADWYSDAMLANFYMLTCPLIYDLGAIAYYALLRQRHSAAATSPITETAQVVIDVYQHRGGTYLHPIKVLHRHSPTMHMLHSLRQGDFEPVTESAVAADVLATMPAAEVGTSRHLVDVWHQVFHDAERLAAVSAAAGGNGDIPPAVRERLLRMVISRDERVLELVRRHLSLDDLQEVGRRCIGTGLIGGKTVGMLLARAILRAADPRWKTLLEQHDSFYICSDVFYSFLVHNGIWWVRQRQHDLDLLLRDAKRARQRILTGNFPEEIVAQFKRMLAYFGQSPIIVRSSSLLEDNFGNAFAGKYESVFCVNQGLDEQRLGDFLSAMRTIYASTMSEAALRYRHNRGLLDQDEQMALLVQRVSGTLHDQLFFPHLAGVALSHNPYVWNETIDPSAGMLRMVHGLGTRAVDRADDDYTRIVALNAPERAPEIGGAGRARAQIKVDVLDLMANQLVSVPFAELVRTVPGLPLDRIASRDEEVERRASERGQEPVGALRLDFAGLLAQKDSFIADMRAMLASLDAAYQHPVDVEFTANFGADGSHRIDLVQCRPLQFLGHTPVTEPPTTIPDQDLLLSTRGPVVGQSRCVTLDRVVQVVGDAYARLPQRDRYAVARLVGRATRLGQDADPPAAVFLIGPGRWGTTTPSLGVPVVFGEIASVEAMCEVVEMGDDPVPDVSLGTHFFNDLVEEEILYLAHFPRRECDRFNRDLLADAPNRLVERLGDEAAPYAGVLRIIEAADLAPGGRLRLFGDCIHQRVLVWREGGAGLRPPRLVVY